MCGVFSNIFLGFTKGGNIFWTNQEPHCQTQGGKILLTLLLKKLFWCLPIKTIVYFLISYISHQIYYILGRGPCWICWKIRAKIAKGSGQTWRYSCLFSTFFLKKENNNNNFFWVKVIQKCFFFGENNINLVFF